MTELFLFHDGRRGEVLLCRALYRAVLRSGLRATVGVCRGDGELFADFVGPRCRVVESDYRNTVHGSPMPLGAMCPPGAVPIELWLGGNEAEPNYQWPDIVDAFHQGLRANGIQTVVGDARGEVPMLDFGGSIDVPPLRRPSVWIDTERTGNDACWFVHDLERIARVLPDHDLLCTAPVPVRAPNVVDVSQLPWPVRSRLSSRCEAIVGTTLDPFVVTLTEANRWKPKALCGWDARIHAPFWDYPGNPMELLGTMDELVDFLIANVAEVAAR